MDLILYDRFQPADSRISSGESVCGATVFQPGSSPGGMDGLDMFGSIGVP